MIKFLFIMEKYLLYFLLELFIDGFEGKFLGGLSKDTLFPVMFLLGGVFKGNSKAKLYRGIPTSKAFVWVTNTILFKDKRDFC